MIASGLDYLRRAAARPFAPEYLSVVGFLAGIALAVLVMRNPL